MSHANIAIFVPHAGCAHRCAFCDQRGISGAARVPDDDEVTAILSRAAESFGQRARPGAAEIAFFGGSFTAIPRGEMLRLLRAARPFLGAGSSFSGIRVSTRPDAVDDEVLDLLAEHGVTAVELGAQSMDDGVLAACGRGHTAQQVVQASRMIRAHGLSLGLQMMTGLPGDPDEIAMVTAKALAALEPDTVRVYPTLVLEHTPLAARWRAGEYVPQPLNDAVALCAELLQFFTDHGVRVIRMGLHDGAAVRARLAGPYHPAFRELCESRVLLQKVLASLPDGTAEADRPPGKLLLTVAPGATSKMAGQHRINIRELQKRGCQIKINEDKHITYLDVKVNRTSERISGFTPKAVSGDSQ